MKGKQHGRNNENLWLHRKPRREGRGVHPRGDTVRHHGGRLSRRVSHARERFLYRPGGAGGRVGARERGHELSVRVRKDIRLVPQKRRGRIKLQIRRQRDAPCHEEHEHNRRFHKRRRRRTALQLLRRRRDDALQEPVGIRLLLRDDGRLSG